MELAKSYGERGHGCTQLWLEGRVSHTLGQGVV